MTPTHQPEDSATGQQVRAGVFGECVRTLRPMLRSQAYAPCLQRSGRSYFC